MLGYTAKFKLRAWLYEPAPGQLASYNQALKYPQMMNFECQIALLKKNTHRSVDFKHMIFIF